MVFLSARGLKTSSIISFAESLILAILSAIGLKTFLIISFAESLILAFLSATGLKTCLIISFAESVILAFLSAILPGSFPLLYLYMLVPRQANKNFSFVLSQMGQGRQVRHSISTV